MTRRHKFKDELGRTCFFDEGRKGSISDSTWTVTTIINDKFVIIGTVEVNGEMVRREMADHFSIKGYEPVDIAEKLAYEKFPKANPIIVHRKD